MVKELNRRNLLKFAALGTGVAVASVIPDALKGQDNTPTPEISERYGSVILASDQVEQTMVESLAIGPRKDVWNTVYHPWFGNVKGSNMKNEDGSVLSTLYASVDFRDQSKIRVESVTRARGSGELFVPGISVVTKIDYPDLVDLGHQLSIADLFYGYDLWATYADGMYINNGAGIEGFVGNPWLELESLVGEENANSLRGEIFDLAKDNMGEEVASAFSQRAGIPFTVFGKGKIVLFNPDSYKVRLISSDGTPSSPYNFDI